MATLADIRTQISTELRDVNQNTWSTDQLNYLINRGLDELGDFYPREIVSTLGTISAGTYSYAASSYTSIYRLDIYTSAGSYRATLAHGIGDGPNSGWELHGGVLYLPPSMTFTAGDTLRAFGYGRYATLTNDGDSTDADTAGVGAVVVFVQVEALQGLLSDRAAFQQWQSNPTNTDTTFLGLNQAVFSVRRRWTDEQRRLRRMRKLG